MKLRKIKKILITIITIIILFLFSGCNRKIALEKSCIQDFETYAYFLDKIDLHPDKENDDYIQLPKTPWELEAEIPEYYQEVWQVNYSNLESIRNVNNETEIWINSSYKNESRFDLEFKQVFIVYQVEKKKWQFVESEMKDPNIHYNSVYISNTGDLWTKFIVDNIESYSDNERLPFLGKYNDVSNSFNVISELNPDQFELIGNPNIVFDNEGKIWMFNSRVGIFKFDPEEQSIKKMMDTPNYGFGSPVIANDGTFYFYMQEFDYQDLDTLFLFLDNTLFQYFPDEARIEAVDVPEESWPIARTLHLDESGRLWYGAIGYRDIDGEWVLLHPDKEEYYKNMQYQAYAWESPDLIFESSDGLLWFNKRTDIYRIDGTAWYNPETGEGCKVTNQISDVLEDSEGRIWLLAEHGLYKYEK